MFMSRDGCHTDLSITSSTDQEATTTPFFRQSSPARRITETGSSENRLAETETPETRSTKTGSPLAVIGAVLGAGLLLIIGVTILLCVLRRYDFIIISMCFYTLYIFFFAYAPCIGLIRCQKIGYMTVSGFFALNKHTI